MAHPRVRQEARLTEEEEVWSGEWLAFSEQATPAHRGLDYKPQPHGHPETHPQGFTQAHDTSVLRVALDIQMEQSHYCTHGLHM